MDPSRIRLEDDRFGLIGMSFRPQNRATFLGQKNGDFVWSIGIVIGDEDEIQTVEVDENGAKSSRMLTPGEVFEGLEILAAHGPEAYLVVGALTLLGMDLRSTGPDTALQFAELLRAAADDRGWRLPLHLIGQPRDLQLSAQGRDILRQTAATLEYEGAARTSLSAAQRLELSATALDSIRRRIARKSLQAYRMHGRWYVVLDNLARSRASELNGTDEAATPARPAPESAGSPFEETASGVVEPVQSQPEDAAVDEPFVSVAEEDAPAGEAPTDDDLAAFVAEGPAAEVPPIDFTTPAGVPAEEAESTAPDDWSASAQAEPAIESEAEHGAGAFEAGFQAVSEEMTPEEPEAQAGAEDEVVAESEAVAEQPETVDQVISETVLEEFIVSEIDAFLREQQTAETQPAIEEFEEQSVTFEDPGDVPVAAEIPTEPDGEGAQPGEETAAEPEADVEVHFEETTEESHTADSPVDSMTAEQVTAADESAAAPLEPPVDEGAESADAETPADMAADESVVSESPAPVSRAEAESEDLLAGEQQPAESEQPAESPVDEPAPPVGDEGEVLESAEAFEPGMEVEQPDGGEEILAEAEADEPEPPQEAPAMEPERAEAATSDETADSGESEQVQAPPDLMAHLRDEVAFLRQQGQEKDRQIVAWINGAQWLQPFVDQIRALEQQVERLGDLQAQRDAERIADLKTDRDRLRERLSQIESEMAARSVTPAPARDRSWFRRMMGSD